MIENIENKSFNELEILASKDNLEALNELGYRYLYGIGTAINYNLAFEYYNAVVKLNRNNLTAKCALAYLYYTGKGTEQNLNIAYQIYKELVDEHQYDDAYYYLGNYYYFGICGIEKDYQKAYEYFNKSIECRKHIYPSKFNLGEMYLQGLYVNKDIEQAIKYFEDILTEEYNDTYYKLAEIYEGKYGKIKDEEKARKYYNKIEIDLCSSLLFYCIAMDGTYDDYENLDENVKEYYKVISSDMLEIEKVYKLLCNHMSLIKSMIEQFKREHPAAILHNRLNCLYSYEYDHIVERLKIKILKCINETNFCKLTKTFDCEEDVLQFSTCIVELFDNSDIEEYVKVYMDYKNQANINDISKDVSKNNEKNLVWLFKHTNWSEHTTGDWESTKWEIYDDLTVKISVSYRLAEEKNKKYSVSIDEDNYKSIVERLKIIKENNITVDAYDGSAWEITQYENGNEIWKRETGYIYGIKELEEIADILNNLIDSRLYRKDLIEFINSKFNFRKDDISKLTVRILDDIYSKVLEYKYKFDNRFYTFGRRDFLEKELDYYLEDNKLGDAFVNFYQYAEANTWIDLSAIPEDLNVQEILDNDYKYKEDGIICEQEKDKLINMIQKLKCCLLSANNHVKSENKSENTPSSGITAGIKCREYDFGSIHIREQYIDDEKLKEDDNLVKERVSEELRKMIEELISGKETDDF